MRMSSPFALIVCCVICGVGAVSLLTPPPLRPQAAKNAALSALVHEQSQQFDDAKTQDDQVKSPMSLLPREEIGVPVGYNQHLGAAYDPTLFENVINDPNAGLRGLTALKDNDLQACFIDHYIRPFVLPREQRSFYTSNLPATIAVSDEDKLHYKTLVGQNIYALCNYIRTYWLDNNLLFKYNSLIGSSTSVENNPGRPLQGRVANSAPNQSSSKSENVHVIEAPPPVALYRAGLQTAKSSQAANAPPRRILTPPPLIAYRELQLLKNHPN